MDDGQVVTANRRALFQEVIRVALLLAGDRVHDDKRESRARASEVVSPPGFPTAGPPPHQFVHLDVIRSP